MRKIISLLSVFIILCGAMSLPGTANADTTINAKGAEDLKKQIEDNLQWRFDMAKAVGQGIAMDGSVEVTPKDSFYEVKLPRISFTFGSEGILSIGTITAKATPDPSGGWLTDITLPSPLTFYDDTNTPVSDITIGSQHFSGVWMPSHEIYSKFDSLYQDIQVRSLVPKIFTSSIGSMKTQIDLKDNGDGTWSGSNDYEISDVKVDISTKNAMHLNINKISANNTYDNVNMNHALEIKKKFRDIFKSGKPITEEDSKSIFETVMSTSNGLIDDMSSESEINGFSFYEENNDPTQPRREISFDKFAFKGISNDIGKEKSAFNLKTSLYGLKTSLIPAGFERLAPNAFNLDIAIDNLPLRKIIEMFINEGMTKNEEKPELAEANIKVLLPKMLQDSGSSLSIQNTFVKSEDINVDLAGKINVSATSPIGAVGKMTMYVRGLDETIKKLQTLAVKPDANQQIMNATGALAIFQMMGQSDPTADSGSASLRNYVFALTPDGKLLLNNVDFNALMASTMGGKNKSNGLTATPK
ncbi:MAG: hypothetical protein KAI76_09180 [Alphaproteobacteria bacterium]|nr:hypothetical protein [Alphaproteobacteria bacterium]